MSEKEFINEEKLSKPSTVTPTLFVGLGGCGSDIAMGVAKLLRQDPDYEEKYKDLIKFAVVDTNINDLEKHRELANETFLISDFEKAEYSKLASGKLFLEPDEFFTQWIPSDYRFRSGDTAGAGQIRIESRLGCYYQMKHNDFNAKFARLFDSMRAHELGHRRIDTREIRIVICYSVAGGTGSGAHLVMSYMLRDLARMVGKPVTIGVSVLPTVFEDKAGVNKDGIFANGYAALKETEYLMKLGSPESKFYPEDGITFHYNPGDPSKTKVYDKPFDFLYIIDKPERFTVDNIKQATASGLYLQFFSSIFKEQAGDYDNYTQHQRFLVPHDFEPKGIPGFTSFYGSFGSTVLHVPSESLAKYCSYAAAIGILRSNYFSSIPAGPKYSSLGTGEKYYTIFPGKNISSGELHISEFPSDKSTKRVLMNRLFRKRIHLLAQCEYNNNRNNYPGDKFSNIFKHGNVLGVVPEEMFGVEQRNDDKISGNMTDAYSKATNKANYSIFQSIVDSIADGSENAPLLQEAITLADRKLKEIVEKEIQYGDEWEQDSAVQSCKRAQNKGLEEGEDFIKLAASSDKFGMSLLNNLEKFFKDCAAETSMTQRRYALLQLMEHINIPEKEEIKSSQKVTLEEKGGLLSGGISEQQQEAFVEGTLSGLKNEMRARITHMFIDEVTAFKKKLGEYLDQAAEREASIVRFLDDRESEIHRWMVHGDTETEKYVLDGEAFQMENGNRLWDFYFADQIKSMDQLDSSHPAVQNIIGASFQDTQSTGSVANRNLFKQLQGYAREHVRRKILGDIESKDLDVRYGLTITEALKLEVEYRALFLSKRSEIEKDPSSRNAIIEGCIAGYRANPKNQININDDLHRDYLIDKIKRLLQEKAGYLCYYDDSREGQGGVRADNVSLIAINEDIKQSYLKDIVGRAGGGFKMVTENWNSRREVVFYQAVLNVPLYVFGRMDRMRHYYYQFKNMAKRSKVLHIDKNWENSLLDLDPQEAQLQHRIGLVQSNIIQFSALFSLHEIYGKDTSPYVLRHDGAYYLRNPEFHGKEVDLTSDDWDCLGHTMSEAIENLPRKLDERAVRYVEYQQILSAVLKGLTPMILQHIVGFPFKWRESYDDLRAQYGDDPNPEQLELLKDFKDSYSLLASALSDLLVKIRNQVKEEETLGADNLGAIIDNQLLNTKGSIQLLEGFERKWDALINPKVGKNLADKRPKIFMPMKQEQINKFLQDLGRSGESRQETAQTTTKETSGSKSS